MAAPVTSAATFTNGGSDVSLPSGIEAGTWQVIVTDSKAAAVAAGVLLNPGTYSSDPKASSHTPIIVGGVGTKIRLALRYASATTWSDATEAVMRVFGADKVPNASGVFPTGTIFWRLDAATFNAAGTTVSSLAGSPQEIQSTGLSITTPTSNDGYALLGAKAVLVVVQTDALFVDLNPASATFPILAQVL
jgi:hypothetical protein